MKQQLAAGILALGVVAGVGTQAWAAPAEGPEFNVSHRCTSGGADVTFVSTDDEPLQVLLLSGTYEDELDREFGLAPGQSHTISTDVRRLDYEVLEDKLEGSDSIKGSLDLATCAASSPPSKAPDAGVVG